MRSVETDEIEVCNFQFFSHIPFCAAFVVSLTFEFYEVSVLLGILVVCSVLYHAHREKTNIYSYADNVAAFSLSMYGNVQLFFSPSTHMLLINIALGLAIAVTFLVGFLDQFKEYYHILHPIGMHIIPAIWICNVMIFQHPLLT